MTVEGDCGSSNGRDGSGEGVMEVVVTEEFIAVGGLTMGD